MSRRPAARAVGGDGIETFLFHLAAEGVISSAQLQRAQEALRLWTPAIAGTPEGDTEEQPPLPGSEAAMEVDNQQLQQNQLSPSQVPAANRRRLNSSQLIQEGEYVLPAALPREADAEGSLSLLPDALLDHLMSLLAAEPGASSIRRTCSWLRSAFDRCNTRLVLRQLESTPLLSPPPQTLKLLLTRPCIRSLTVERDAAAWQALSLHNAGQSVHRLEELSLRHMSMQTVSFLSHYTKLKHLDLRDCVGLNSLHGLASCVELQHLDMRGCKKLQDLGLLATCARLQHLDLSGCSLVKDLEPLASCVELQHLSLSGCELVDDISPLASCVKLQHLDLSGCHQLQDLDPLSACAQLKHLDLKECDQAADLGPLAACTELLFLHVSSDEVEDISALAACTRLQSLTIWYSQLLEDLGPLASCCELQYLDLGGCRTVGDLGPLTACVELRHLILCESVDVQALAACVKLRYLDLSACYGLTDIGPLASCVDLQVLDISGCSEVEDLCPLSSCVKLQYLDMRRCGKAKDPQPLALCRELQVLEVSNECMAAEDLAPLAALSHLTILRE